MGKLHQVNRRIGFAIASLRLMFVVCVFGFSAEAFAFESAPVCDPSGASAVAPIPVVPIVGAATIEQLVCSGSSFDANRDIPERLRHPLSPVSPLAATVRTNVVPRRAAPQRVHLERDSANLYQGHQLSVYRPPR